MDNRTFVKAIKTAAALLELHDENEFKVRSYQNAVFALEKYSGDLSIVSEKELASFRGVGKSIAENILQMQQSGTFPLLQELIDRTPDGIMELLSIKGIGPKKVRVLWKELSIENKTQLLEAVENDALIKIKGFGKKTQEKIRESLTFEEANKGKLLFSQAEAFCNELNELLQEHLPQVQLMATGQVRRKLEVIDHIEFIVPDHQQDELIDLLTQLDFLDEQPNSSPFNWRTKTRTNEVQVSFIFCSEDELQSKLFCTTADPGHLMHTLDGKTLKTLAESKSFASEKEIYDAAKLPFYIPELREGLFEFDLSEKELNSIISLNDLKGILHNHTTYSDGKNTVWEMAEYCRDLGFEYLGVNDHSKSAYFYANGMYEEQVMKQQREIDELNKTLAPFRIFKGIEVDILQDGSLDYDFETMKSFDFTVASIHSAFNMDIVKATERIIKAVSHPLVTMLGHMTGRLFLRREGYPVDHQAVIDACAEFNVIIEINANPYRLDMDWRWIRKAIDKGVMISINPDAHSTNGLHDIYYGVCAARKAALPVDMTFNAKGVKEIEDFFIKRKNKALA